MMPPDATSTLRTVAALRVLCARLPHLATEDERRELELFTTLETDPRSVTEHDVRALVAGWSAWWRQGAVDRICGMADQIPADIHMSIRELATLSTAAHLACWQRTQRHVWTCTLCVGQARVATDLRQQTPPPRRDAALLVISLAPPFRAVSGQTIARSATNDDADGLRLFIENTLDREWSQLVREGLVLFHAVKCAIRPQDGHQDPPPEIVDACAPRHLATELSAVRPAAILAMERMAWRALARAYSSVEPSGPSLPLVNIPKDAYGSGGYGVIVRGQPVALFFSPFFRADPQEAATTLRCAADAAHLGRIGQADHSTAS